MAALDEGHDHPIPVWTDDGIECEETCPNCRTCLDVIPNEAEDLVALTCPGCGWYCIDDGRSETLAGCEACWAEILREESAT